jgi:hypothetical protein
MTAVKGSFSQQIKIANVTKISNVRKFYFRLKLISEPSAFVTNAIKYILLHII